MDIIGYFKKINAIGKYLLLTILILNLFSVAFAGTGKTNICKALQGLCEASQTFLAGAAMLLIVLAGTIYAIGQILGAETRARASVWATAMLTGALIGIIIYLVAPVVIQVLLQGTGATPPAGANPCSFTCA